MRVAIVGTGISGLVAAYLLRQDHGITVFEANDYVGGHTHTEAVNAEDGTHDVDTGFIVFNDWTYPNFRKLIDRLGVSYRDTSMCFGVRCDTCGLEYSTDSLNSLFADRMNLARPRFYRLVRDILRFNRIAPKVLDHDDEEMTIAQFVEQEGFGHDFVHHHLLPLGSAIWSCPVMTFGEFPVRFVVEFFVNHGMLNIYDQPTWHTIVGGSERYVEAMTRDFRDRILLSTPVERIERRSDGVSIETSAGIERFDHVIVACHSDQALAILGDATDSERELLGAFAYQRNEVTLHTDTSVLPLRRRAWANWNYRVHHDSTSHATVNYNMNGLQGLETRDTYVVTLNGEDPVESDRVLGRYVYQHPVYTTQRHAAQERHPELIDANRTSFCGAYWGYGFHEDGVNSALRVCKAFGKTL